MSYAGYVGLNERDGWGRRVARSIFVRGRGYEDGECASCREKRENKENKCKARLFFIRR